MIRATVARFVDRESEFRSNRLSEVQIARPAVTRE